MPTARELLEQADALMRRNRAQTLEARAEEAPAVAPDIPVLTEALEASAPVDDEVMPASVDAVVLEREPQPEMAVGAQADAIALDDVPLLTDVVEEIEAPTIAEEPEDEGEPSQWLDDEAGRGEASVTEPIDDSIIEVPPVAAYDVAEESPAAHERADETPIAIEIAAPVDASANEASAATDVDELALDELEAPSAPAIEPPSASAVLASARTLVAPSEPAAPMSIPVDDDERWDSLAEEIRMQVLQRIDIFTDTGLREQLTARLQPIVDRASADLVATINQHVGQLLRAYVAEAIEREIEKWRHGSE